MSATTLDLLRAAREYAADPEHIVTNLNRVYEDAAGNDTYADVAVRGCLLGCAHIATRCEGDDANAVYDAIEAHMINGSYEDTMRAGHAAILATYDRAIAAEESK